jgi:hypothetical protein
VGSLTLLLASPAISHAEESNPNAGQPGRAGRSRPKKQNDVQRKAVVGTNERGALPAVVDSQAGVFSWAAGGRVKNRGLVQI